MNESMVVVKDGTIKVTNASGATIIFNEDVSITIKSNRVDVNSKGCCLSRHEKDLILSDHAILKNEGKKLWENKNAIDFKSIKEELTKRLGKNVIFVGSEPKLSTVIKENEELEDIIESNDRVLESVLEFVYEKELHNELLDALHNKKNESPESFNDEDYEFVSEMFLDMYNEEEFVYEGITEAFDSSQKIEQIKDYLKKCGSNLTAVDAAINQSKISCPSKKKETIQDLLEFLDKVQLWMESE